MAAKYLSIPALKKENFYKLQKECLAKGKLYEDPDFPTTEKSLFFDGIRPAEFKDVTIVWKRPKEIVPDAEFLVDGASRFDIKQGSLGDCWFLASIANLTLYPALLEKVVPKDQQFDEKYTGIFHFRFWQYGEWIEVVIDDRLPVHDGELIYTKSSTKNEFWTSLLEKAYAKLYGSYQALEGGFCGEAFEDFTGGVSQGFALEECPSELFDIILNAYKHRSMLCCSTDEGDKKGLVGGHAYSITKVCRVLTKSGKKARLVRIRNPWGETEWTGDWCDKSEMWNNVLKEEKERIKFTDLNDGEFWMSFQDVKKYFNLLEICCIHHEVLLCEKVTRNWSENRMEGKWKASDTEENLSVNPQYHITLQDPDETDEDDNCTVIISLMEKYQRKLNRNEIHANKFLVFEVKELEYFKKPLDKKFFNKNEPIRQTDYHHMRHVSSMFRMPPGLYCIVLMTADAENMAEYLLRVISEKSSNLEKIQ